MSDPLLAGTPYRMVAPLGRGGMGEVVEAEHVALGKRVVVKLLHLTLADRPDLVDRMRVEAQSLARLVHPNLVAVTDFGQTPDGRTYLVMERLYGRTLREELKDRGPLPAGEIVDIGRQALAGLSVAHEAGIVHRDVKLDNLFLCDALADGRRLVKVLDFGIAKVLANAGDGRAPAPLAFPTEEGVSVGTPRFFSPEQARGQPVDARTDIYAMGAVMYALATGRGPFDHKATIYELTRAHAMEPPPRPSEVASATVHPELERVILKALEKKPEDRYPSAAELSAELARVSSALDPLRGLAWAQTEVVEPVSPPGAEQAKAREKKALDARATVRMPELADAQDAARREAHADRFAPPSPAAGRPPESAVRAPAPAASPGPVAARGTMMLLEPQRGPHSRPLESPRPPSVPPGGSAAGPPATIAHAGGHDPRGGAAAQAPTSVAIRPMPRPGAASAPARRTGMFILLTVVSALVFAGLAALLVTRFLH